VELENPQGNFKNQNNVLPNKIGLIGHSEGAIIATMIAGNSEDIAFIVLLAGSGISGEEIIYAQTESMFKQLEQKEIEKQIEIRRKLISVIKSEPDKIVAEDKLRNLVNENLNVLSPKQIQDTTVFVQKIVNVFNSDWYSPSNDMKNITCPVLSLFGEKDIQALPSKNIPAIENSLKEGGNKNYTVKELPGLNHLFQTAQTGDVNEYSRIEETISPIVLDYIANWIMPLALEKE
jgi:pimeloyl-ACP methyl ester carboxylesterase